VARKRHIHLFLGIFFASFSLMSIANAQAASQEQCVEQERPNYLRCLIQAGIDNYSDVYVDCAARTTADISRCIANLNEQVSEEPGCTCATIPHNLPSNDAIRSLDLRKKVIPQFDTPSKCADSSFNNISYAGCRWVGPEPQEPSNQQNEFQLPSDISSLNRFSNTGNTGVERAQTVIGRLIKFLTGIIGTFAFVVLVYAGVLWMTSGGNADRERRAKEIMFWGVLGVVIIFTSYGILQFVLQNAF